jgi:Chaperone for flagella basal body P-ring formation
MSHSSRFGYCFLGMLVLSAPGMISAQAACYSTPAMAIDSLNSASFVPPVSEGGGYRIRNIQSDPVLGQRWATVVRCDHPEWPVIALQFRRSQTLQASREHQQDIHAIPVIRAGDVVRLWKQEEFVRIEAVGVAEENGYSGKTIQVRLLHHNTEVSSAQELFAGVVRGPSDVEMQP